METGQAGWLLALAMFALGAGLAWGAAHWWFGRKLRAGAASRERLDKARQFAAQQAAQARRQIEVLQQEMAALRLGNSRRVLPVMPASAPAPEAAAETDESEQPTDGFADTQVLMPGQGAPKQPAR